MRASTAVFRSASRRGVILAIGVAMVTAAAAAAGNDTAALSGRRNDDPSFTYLVPAVVQTPGLEGTQWRTALSLVNQSGDRAYYRMYYHLPSGSHEATGALASTGGGRLLAARCAAHREICATGDGRRFPRQRSASQSLHRIDTCRQTPERAPARRSYSAVFP